MRGNYTLKIKSYKKMKNLDATEAAYSAAIKELVSQGYDLNNVYQQKKVRDDKRESRLIGPMDEVFSVTTPEDWSAHFEKDFIKVGDVTVEVGGPKVLSLSNIRSGGQFKLAPAWRNVLRERYGITPTDTITIRELSFFKDTKVIDRLVIESNQHIADLRVRKHVLQAVCITNFTEFMTAVKRSEEMQDESHTITEKTSKVTKAEKKAVEVIAADYL